jgi:hypothetical protein
LPDDRLAVGVGVIWRALGHVVAAQITGGRVVWPWPLFDHFERLNITLGSRKSSATIE